ncbi:MAG: hypothetical protein SVY53_13860 [Chloroflexota bacterium]|nr:hypothetical protein [Chloroflexota bacterium]
MKTLGKGFAGTVYMIEKEGAPLVLKEFAPSWLAKLAHQILCLKKHPYCTDEGVRAAFHRRRIACRLSKMWDQDNYIEDAIAMHGNRSFLCRYVEGHSVTHNELDLALSFARELKNNLYEAGLPTISLEGLPLKYIPGGSNRWVDIRNLLITEKGNLILIDFESGIPRFKRGKFVLDDTDLDRLESYVRGTGNDELLSELELLREIEADASGC